MDKKTYLLNGMAESLKIIVTNQMTHVGKSNRTISNFLSKSLKLNMPLQYYIDPIYINVDVITFIQKDKKGWGLEGDEHSNPQRLSGFLHTRTYWNVKLHIGEVSS